MRSTFRIHAVITVAIIVTALGGTASAEPPMGPVTVTASNPGDQFEPAVAWDHEHNQWLTVWEQDVSGVRQIVGRLVNGNGYPVDFSFFISDAALDQTAPDVVYDPGHDRYLVVWVNQLTATDTDIVGRFVPWDGLDPVQLPFAIEYPTSLQFAPALEYAPFPIDEFFVVWENIVGFDPSTIRAKRLYPDSGSAVGPSVEVVGDATYQRRKPAVAWNADAGRYLVVYERYEGTDQEDVYAASVSYSGTVFSPDLGIAGYPPEENQVDVAECGGSWMVAWKNGQVGVETQVYARSVAGDLSLGMTLNLSDPWIEDLAPAVACNPHGPEFFIVWQSGFSGDVDGVAGGVFDSGGHLLESFNVQAPTGASTLDYTHPAVSVGDYQSRAFVVWETERADLIHQDLAGRWVEMVLFADNFETGTTSRWSTAAP